MTTFQRLTFDLDGITAGDYLAYVRNPEPPRAEILAGLPMIPEVRDVSCRGLEAVAA